jgi:hypothetical protein
VRSVLLMKERRIQRFTDLLLDTTQFLGGEPLAAAADRRWDFAEGEYFVKRRLVICCGPSGGTNEQK